ncbi:MAG TPA: 16S rRNA (adenine(1518)-N(6)/adenine(1519)-N(6))-dimethyltransferase RsmA [Bacillota bacterium]|nr:16S rRNA (adenine(1518)-N(6)/adenine(1519)-N(6))-dimethyltransferase RsmA [Bacillota bacterium]
MSDLGATLSRHGIRLDKSFGQHLLVDPSALRKIVDLAEIKPGERVLEIGPGAGNLTLALCAAGAHVEAVELDRRWDGVLSERLAGQDVTLTWGDALKADLPPADKLVANLPYNVAGPILGRVLPMSLHLYVFALQLEVAERAVAQVGDPRHGSLSLFIAYYGRAQLALRIPPGAFLPPPKVRSAIVRIRPHSAAPVDVAVDRLFPVIRTAFTHRRKTIANALGVRPELIRAAGVDPLLRPQMLSLHDFAALVRAGVY